MTVYELINCGLSDSEVVKSLTQGNTYEYVSEGLVSSVRDLVTNGLFPPSADHSLYIAMHNHRYGVSVYQFWSDHSPEEAEVVKWCGIDFEPEREEYIDISDEMGMGGIPSLPPKKAPLLEEPWTVEQLASNMDEAGYITVRLRVDLGDALDNNIEQWNDLLCGRIAGGELLQDISWNPVECKNQAIIIEVEAAVDHIVNKKDRCSE